MNLKLEDRLHTFALRESRNPNLVDIAAINESVFDCPNTVAISGAVSGSGDFSPYFALIKDPILEDYKIFRLKQLIVRSDAVGLDFDSAYKYFLSVSDSALQVSNSALRIICNKPLTLRCLVGSL